MTARSHKCPSCGKQHVPGFAFCQRCGVPLEAELASDPPLSSRTSDADEEEATDLNGRILDLIERGKRKEAIRLYHEALGCNLKMAEAAIDELAKNVEFAEARPATASEAGTRATSLSGWLAAIKTLIGFGRG
ncbi:MAG TPA: hypothetical protein VG125_32000 [Pirellulales bacterium]|nr:hypothetical protein [Pirellulales bacterium]